MKEINMKVVSYDKLWIIFSKFQAKHFKYIKQKYLYFHYFYKYVCFMVSVINYKMTNIS